MVNRIKPILVERIAVVLGYGLVVGGVGMAYRPAGVVTAGVLLIVAALWRSKP